MRTARPYPTAAAAHPARRARAEPVQRDRDLKPRSAEEECVKRQSLATRSSAGNGGGWFAPGRRLSRALSRGSADGARRPTPGSSPCFPEYVVARRYAGSGTAPSRLVRVAHPPPPGIFLPVKITVKSAHFVCLLRTAQAPLLSSDLGWRRTGTCAVGRGTASTCDLSG
jgi:hypothetical protein